MHIVHEKIWHSRDVSHHTIFIYSLCPRRPSIWKWAYTTFFSTDFMSIHVQWNHEWIFSNMYGDIFFLGTMYFISNAATNIPIFTSTRVLNFQWDGAFSRIWWWPYTNEWILRYCTSSDIRIPRTLIRMIHARPEKCDMYSDLDWSYVVSKSRWFRRHFYSSWIWFKCNQWVRLKSLSLRGRSRKETMPINQPSQKPWSAWQRRLKLNFPLVAQTETMWKVPMIHFRHRCRRWNQNSGFLCFVFVHVYLLYVLSGTTFSLDKWYFMSRSYRTLRYCFHDR